MSKKINYILLLLALFSFVSDGLKHLYTLKGKSDYFTTDNAGNSYILKGDEIKKFNSTGELLKVYSNKKSGRITSIDASNALRVLVFYKDFAQLIFLDSQLSQNGESISLENMGMEQCDLACTSFNNGIWLYNRQNAELVRLDENLNKIVNTGNLNRLLNTELHPTFLTEHNGYIYLNNPNEGILIFDIYGTYYKTLNIKGLKNFQLNDENLSYFLNHQLNVYNSRLLSESSFPLTDTTIIQARIEKEKLYLRYADSITVSSFVKQ